MLDAKRKLLHSHPIFANCMTSGKKDSHFVMTVALGTFDVSSLEILNDKGFHFAYILFLLIFVYTMSLSNSLNTLCITPNKS